jgi:ABC-type glycerol-3-phosphate transport system permease component
VVISRAAKAVKYTFLFLVTFFSIIPFALMIVMTTHTTEEIYTGVGFMPGTNLLVNLGYVFSPGFFRSFYNSLIVSVTATVCSVLFSSMAAYALVAYRFRGRGTVYNFILLVMMIPGSISLVGYMYEMRVLRLTSTLIPIIVPWFAQGFGAFWMTQYLKSSFQINLVESARIDGCNELRLFFSIVIPCIRTAVVTLALLVFLWSWNSYLTPLIFINSSANITIPLYIKSLGNEFRTDYAAQITGLTVSLVPIIALFIGFSKNFIQGITAGAIKG